MNAMDCAPAAKAEETEREHLFARIQALEKDLDRMRENEQRRAALFLEVQKKAAKLETQTMMMDSMLTDAKLIIGGLVIQITQQANKGVPK